MSVRYLFNTAGKYVAFMQGHNVFSPSCEWLGFVRNGSELYAPSGEFVGIIMQDDRVATSPLLPRRLRAMAPLRPLRPLRPLAPLARLPQLPLPAPWTDVFRNGPRKSLVELEIDESALAPLLEKKLFAYDKTGLGTISRNRYDPESIANPYGLYGSRYNAQSILNPYGNYGSKYSLLSPFNPYTVTPPYCYVSVNSYRHISVNRALANAVSPYDLLAFIGVDVDER